MITPPNSIGNPIFNLQTFLAKISKYYDDIPSVIPDGIYGESTENSVRAFQNQFSLNPTGITDLETWEQILLIYELVNEFDLTPNQIMPFTFNERQQPVILENSDALFLMQIMINKLSKVFLNINEIELSGIYDDGTRNEINTLRAIMLLDESDFADIPLWNRTVRLYNQHKHRV